MKNNKVAIVGLSWNKNNAPFDDKTFDIWTMNHGCYLLNNIDLCFDMHNWNTSEYTVNYYDEYLTKKRFNFPIVVPDYNENILSEQIIYPKKDVIDICGHNIRNSIPAMMMYAYIKKYEYIYLFGMDDNEFVKYPDMGFSLYYVLGFLRGKGMKIYFCNDYMMDNEYFYGYQKLKIENIRDNKRNYKVVTENSDK